MHEVTDTEVAIVGGGLAGLCAARLLHAAGIDFILVEARDRPGGRIFTADGAGLPCDDGFDLGPSWYWPQAQPAIAQLVEELGLRTFAQNSEGDVIFERMSRETPQRYRPLAQAQQSMRLAGGSAALVHAIARGLPPERIWLGSRVTAMNYIDNRVELVIAQDDDRSSTLKAKHAIAAVPPRLLATTVSFAPALESGTADRWSRTPTWMAPHAKFFALYDHSFWREAGLSGTAQSMVGPMVEMHDATTSSGTAALFGFLGVGAEARAAMGEQDLKRACLEQFVRLFGKEALRPRATLFKDWAADSLTATSADRSAGGHAAPTDASWVSGVWHGRLSLAGSETSPVDNGYLAGAVIAAKRAVDETISHSQRHR
jgi:monoamine oxidase